ncbi:MAG: hypothetical protein GSR81_02440 [Desulfurococcales archaeon]|nr:hypothetical protein [Desulfurococcales archaeon]
MEESTTVNAVRVLLVSMVVITALVMIIMVSSPDMGSVWHLIESGARGDWNGFYSTFMKILGGFIVGELVVGIAFSIIGLGRSV